jgi:hypothetical protein
METLFWGVIALSAGIGVAVYALFGDPARAVIDGFSMLGFGWLVLVGMEAIDDRLRKHYRGRQ